MQDRHQQEHSASEQFYAETTRAVYVVEHPTHICNVYYPPTGEEDNFTKKWIQRGAGWLERICTVHPLENRDEEELLEQYCSRRMILLRDEANGSLDYLAGDFAENLLDVGKPDWGWMPFQTYGPDTVLRFAANSDPEMVIHPYHEWEDTNFRDITVHLYIQEAMVRPNVHALS